MAIQLGELLRNKKALAGVGVAGLVGVEAPVPNLVSIATIALV